MAETTCLLNMRAGNRTGGSNPPLTANEKSSTVRSSFFFIRANESNLFDFGRENKKRSARALKLFSFDFPTSGITTEGSHPELAWSKYWTKKIALWKEGLSLSSFPLRGSRPKGVIPYFNKFRTKKRISSGHPFFSEFRKKNPNHSKGLRLGSFSILLRIPKEKLFNCLFLFVYSFKQVWIAPK